MPVQETSKNAYYDEVLPTLSKRQELVYNAISTETNVTNSELAIILNWSINRVTPRVFELRDKGMVIESGKRKCTVTSRRVIAWQAIKDTLF